MTIRGKETNWQKFRRSTSFFDPWSAFLGAGPAAVAAYKTYSSPADPRWWWWTLAACAGGALVVQFFKTRSAFREQAKKDSTHELQGCLQTLETVLLGPDLEPAKRLEAGLRLTVYVPYNDDTLEQAMEYVGDHRTPGKTAGRKQKTSLGVVGRAYRDAISNPAKHESFSDARMQPDYEAFLSQMIREYGYSREEAKKLNELTHSWFAFAIVADGTVEGVLYCDSRKADFFTAARQEDIRHAIVGIAYFVHLRYA
jgi:hypothetical protein